MDENPLQPVGPDTCPLHPDRDSRGVHGPDTCPLIQEAESRKYGNEMVMVLRLRDGDYAVFNAARELYAIARGFGLVDAINSCPAPRAPAKPAVSLAAENLLTSLGL